MSEIQQAYLIDKRYKLELIAEIPDMEVYIAGWEKLAADFRAAGMFTNSAICEQKKEWYQKQYEAECK